MFIADRFKPRPQLEVENLFLRHQLNIALRHAPLRLRLRGNDRRVGMDAGFGRACSGRLGSFRLTRYWGGIEPAFGLLALEIGAQPGRPPANRELRDSFLG
jgi:hypothetical protein